MRPVICTSPASVSRAFIHPENPMNHYVVILHVRCGGGGSETGGAEGAEVRRVRKVRGCQCWCGGAGAEVLVRRCSCGGAGAERRTHTRQAHSHGTRTCTAPEHPPHLPHLPHLPHVPHLPHPPH